MRSSVRHLVTRSTRARGLQYALGWAAIGPLACITLVAAVTFSSWHVPVEQNLRFQGVLRPVTTPLTVSAPAFSVLQQMLVSEGEVVRAGQSLVLLDSVTMQARLNVIQRGLVSAYLSRQCVLETGAQRPSTDYLDAIADWLGTESLAGVEDVKAHADQALADCRLRDEVWASLQRDLDRQIALGQEGADLLDKQIKVLVEQSARRGPQAGFDPKVPLSGFDAPNAAGTPEANREDQAFAALQLLLARNAALRATHEIEVSREERVLARKMRHAKRAEILTQDIEYLLAERAALEELLEFPRIVAPDAGVISRIRDPGPGYVSGGPTPIVELARAGAQRFALSVNVPADQLGLLADGARVDVALAGTGRDLPLSGHLDFEQSPSGPVSEFDGAAPVMVRLDDLSFARLSSPKAGMALTDARTQSQITVNVGPSSFGQLLTQVFEDVAPGLARYPAFFLQKPYPTAPRDEAVRAKNWATFGL